MMGSDSFWVLPHAYINLFKTDRVPGAVDWIVYDRLDLSQVQRIINQVRLSNGILIFVGMRVGILGCYDA